MLNNIALETIETFNEFFSDIKAMSELLYNWCLTNGEIDNETLFLAISLKKRVEKYEANSMKNGSI